MITEETARDAWWQRGGLWLGLLVAAALLAVPRFGWALDADLLPEERQPLLNSMAAVLALMSIWWITEAIPIAATALLPLVLFPLLKIPPAVEIAREYGHPLVFLYLGGFLIALAIEETGLHRRVALVIISAVGDNPRRIVLGFMLATFALSMWLSNTATALMMLPIALSVLTAADAQQADPEQRRRFGTALMLSVAYAATLGGMATLVGTPPNVMFKGFFESNYPDLEPVSFAGWMKLALPFSATFLVLMWLVLTRWSFPLTGRSLLGGRSVVREQLRALGPMSPAEWRMAGIFLVTALLWMTRAPVANFGWGPALGFGKVTAAEKLQARSRAPSLGEEWVDDTTVAVGMAILCFLIPAGGKNERGEPKRGALLSWSSTKRLPWGVLLLFGGGLALAAGMKTSGLDLFLGRKLGFALEGLSQTWMYLVTATGVTFFSEIASNLACVSMLLPILKGIAADLEIDPRSLMTVATLAASCGFMLPVATPPNAIVYGTGRIRMWEMVKAGFWLDWLGIGLLVLFARLLG